MTGLAIVHATFPAISIANDFVQQKTKVNVQMLTIMGFKRILKNVLPKNVTVRYQLYM